MRLKDERRIRGFKKVCEEYVGKDWVSLREFNAFCKKVGSYAFSNIAEHLVYEERTTEISPEREEKTPLTPSELLEYLNTPIYRVNYDEVYINENVRYELIDEVFYKVDIINPTYVEEVRILGTRLPQLFD